MSSRLQSSEGFLSSHAIGLGHVFITPDSLVLGGDTGERVRDWEVSLSLSFLPSCIMSLPILTFIRSCLAWQIIIVCVSGSRHSYKSYRYYSWIIHSSIRSMRDIYNNENMRRRQQDGTKVSLQCILFKLFALSFHLSMSWTFLMYINNNDIGVSDSINHYTLHQFKTSQHNDKQWNYI